MQANFAYNACMRSMQKKQYTLRDIPTEVDRTLRQKARASGTSLNQCAIDALRRGAGLTENPVLYNDLDPLIGSWKEDPAFDEAIKLQDQVDLKIWS